MKCPFTFANPACDVDEECREDCALKMKSTFCDAEKKKVAISEICAIAAMDCNLENVTFTPQCDRMDADNRRDISNPYEGRLTIIMGQSNSDDKKDESVKRQ